MVCMLQKGRLEIKELQIYGLDIIGLKQNLSLAWFTFKSNQV